MPAKYWPLTRGSTVTSGYGDRTGGYHWGTDFGRERRARIPAR